VDKINIGVVLLVNAIMVIAGEPVENVKNQQL